METDKSPGHVNGYASIEHYSMAMRSRLLSLDIGSGFAERCVNDNKSASHRASRLTNCSQEGFGMLFRELGLRN